MISNALVLSVASHDNSWEDLLIENKAKRYRSVFDAKKGPTYLLSPHLLYYNILLGSAFYSSAFNFSAKIKEDQILSDLDKEHDSGT